MKLRTLEETRKEFGFDKVKTKEDVVATILDKNFGDSDGIMLKHPEGVTMEQSRKDFRRERVLLNGIPFVPSKEHEFRNQGFGQTLGELCTLLGEKDDDAKEQILRNACRTGSGADAYFIVRSLLCVPELFLVQRSCTDDPPVKVDLFRSPDGRLCSRVVSVNTFSLFEENDVGLDIHHPPPPYLVVETQVTDEMIFNGGKDQRWLTLRAFQPRPELRVTSSLADQDDMHSINSVSSTSSARIIPLQSPHGTRKRFPNIFQVSPMSSRTDV